MAEYEFPGGAGAGLRRGGRAGGPGCQRLRPRRRGVRVPDPRHPGGVDALVDLASRSPEELNAYAAVVRDGGRVVSSVGAAGEGPGRVNVGAVPTPENLERLAKLLEAGTLTVPVQVTYPLDQAGQAMEAL